MPDKPTQTFASCTNVTVNPIQVLDSFSDFHSNKPQCVSHK